jgi:hypothetical protein
MTEITIDNYFAKLLEIQNATEDSETTETQLRTLVGQLGVLDTQIDTELTTMPFPSSVSHLNKLILVQNERSRKANFQNFLEELIECRNGNIDTVASTGTYEDIINYSNETRSIKNYINNEVIPSCNCIKVRLEIIKRNSKK